MRFRASAYPGEGVLALRERKRVLDAAWVASIVVLFLAVLVVWLLRLLHFDMARMASTAFAYAVGYVLAAAVTNRLETAAALVASVRVLQFSALLFLALAWHLVGALDNPVFLLAFTLPVIVSGIMKSGLQPQVVALLSVLVVSTLVILDARASPFRDLIAAPAYQITTLTLFALLQAGIAFLSPRLAAPLYRWYTRLQASPPAHSELQGLFQAVFVTAPEPGLVVHADTGEIVHVSTSFLKRMLLEPSDVVGKDLRDLLKIVEPDRLRQVLRDRRGVLPFCVYHVGRETRIANLHFHRAEHAGSSYVFVGLQEITERYYLQAAFDAVSDPLILVGTDQHLLYANRAAQDLFGPTYFAMDVRSSPRLATFLEGWAHDATDATTALRMQIGDERYDVSGVLARLPSASEACTIFWLRSVAREEALLREVMHDALTGLYNRRYFDDVLARYVAQTRRGGQLNCAFLDLDAFKVINDTAGHASGDAMLRHFATLMKHELRETDVVARLGGDEFAILFPEIDARAAVNAIKRLYERASASPLVFGGRTWPVAFSCGIAGCRKDDSAQILLARADRALYQAKTSNPNGWLLEE